jgi:HPr kinase/phosphorylase
MAFPAPPPESTPQSSTPQSSTSGVAVSRIVERFDLEVVTDAGLDLDTQMVTSATVNRPGLQWAGYSEHFPTDRVQVIGGSEVGYLVSLPEGVRASRLEQYAQLGMPVVIISRGYWVLPEVIELADLYGIPVLRTADPPAEVIRSLEWFLAMELAPRVVLHAGLVDVAGEGVLIRGRSGIGKSETALELIRRGHRLIADDTVEVRRPTEHDLIGMAPGRMRHFMEVKGIGIVNLRLMYGVGAVKSTGDLSLAVSLEREDPERDFGLEPDSMEILGMHLPLVTIPMRPGRNAAVIIEAAAADVRARRLLRRRDIEDRSDVRADTLEQI